MTQYILFAYLAAGATVVESFDHGHDVFVKAP